MIERLYDLSLYVHFFFHLLFYFIKTPIVVRATVVSPSPHEGLPKPKHFNVDFPLYIHHFWITLFVYIYIYKEEQN